MPIDLHLHSTASDGRLKPEELVRLSSKIGLKAISITDHDTVCGVETALNEAKKYHLNIVPAVELSSDFGGKDLHFLGYFIDFKQKWFLKHLEKLKDFRYKRALKMLEKLKEEGLEINFKDVIEEANDGVMGRLHLARVIVKKGYVDSIQKAFKRYLARNSHCYVAKYTYTPKEVIEIILNVGGIPVLAHPGLYDIDDKLDEFISYGLAGIEIYHTNHTWNDVRKYKDIAKRKGLLKTGGSDCHGLESSQGLLIGSLKIPDQYYKDLLKEKSSRDKQSHPLSGSGQ
ncbi:MAG: PHP domain-containing protein [Actinomycetia bacterium]|nr:PHP domain-containing protein [Actinomycetes bacterium]